MNTQPYTFFFFNDTATTEIYTLSLHDALPIFAGSGAQPRTGRALRPAPGRSTGRARERAGAQPRIPRAARSEEHTSELQSHSDLVCRLLLEKKKKAGR